MTVIELIEELKRFDDTDILVFQIDGDYAPIADHLVRVRIGADDKHYHCAAFSHSSWPSGGYSFALEEDEGS
jgi:hypothetical protein